MRTLESTLQCTLETIYRVDGAPPVDAYRVERWAGGEREALLLRVDGEVTEVGLFIDDNIRAGAEATLRGVSRELDALCVAIEGVSHFVYFTLWGAARPISMAELELQAEIDKFLLIWLCLEEEPMELSRRLFDAARLHAPPEALPRYRLAHREGRRYARWLADRHRTGRTGEAVDNARRLYRASLPRKLECIARAT